MSLKTSWKYVFLIGVALALAGCAGDAGPAGPAGATGPAGPQGPPGPAGSAAELDVANLSCTECHNDTTLITGKKTAWEETVHGSGGAYVRGTSSSCAGCHSGGGFVARIEAGIAPNEVEAGDPNPTRQDCRTCHQIHSTYSGADWALTTTDAVAMYAVEGSTYDGGEGNLCASCHQPRRVIGEIVDGNIEVTSTHWGPHHGGQSSMLLGVAGVGADGLTFTGDASSHYNQVEGTCVGCHMGENATHTFEPDLAVCESCHSGAENFDINGTQTEVQELLDQVEAQLIAKGWLDEEGHPIVQSVPAAEAAALWNWIYIAHEDGSLGVHNPGYTRQLLEEALATLGG